MEIRNFLSNYSKFKVGDKVKVKYDFNTTGIDGYYYGIITKLLDEFDNYNGTHHPMVQLNNDEFHTYYMEFVEVIKENNPYENKS